MISKLYPICATLVSKGRVKIRPTKVYVDVPYKVYAFAYYLANDLSLRKSFSTISPIEIKKEWKKFVEENKQELCTKEGKVVASVGLITQHPFVSKDILIIKIRINWKNLFTYLEEQSKKDIEEIRKNGNRIRMVYNKILHNTLRSTSFKSVFEIREADLYKESKRHLTNFIKVLKRSKDYAQIEQLLYYLLFLISSIEKNLKKWKVFSWQLKTDWKNLYNAWKRIDIPACYFYLRNMLEVFVRMRFFSNLLACCRSCDKRAISLVPVMLFDADRIKERGKNVYNEHEYRQLKEEIINLLSKIKFEDFTDEENYEKYIQSISKLLPRTGSKLIEWIEVDVKKDSCKLENLWRLCSEIVHNQPPLPFYSLYEIKVFKHSLEYYVSEISNFWGIELEKIKFSIENQNINFNKVRKILNCILYNFKNKVKKRIGEINADNYWFEPGYLFSIIRNIWGASISQLYQYEITFDDFLLFIDELDSLSFKIGMKEKVKSTFEAIFKVLSSYILSLCKDARRLNKKEMETLVFWLLCELNYSV